jgi:hypothetical protein
MTTTFAQFAHDAMENAGPLRAFSEPDLHPNVLELEQVRSA